MLSNFTGGADIENGNFKVGIGFATGRRNFQKVLKTNIFNWLESGLVQNRRISLNLFVAYDLAYQKTKSTDYTRIPKDIADQINGKYFISNSSIRDEIEDLIKHRVITPEESKLVFGKGYAAKRNAVLYFAIQSKMDYLIFLDDDEYPMAVTNTRKKAIWSGQYVLSNHLKYITRADITHGLHCGYISPIPQIEFNEILKEDTFRLFIEAISNDIIKWEKIKSVMADGGITYADTGILMHDEAEEVPEINHAKFISGANLCINLTDLTRLFPFYNPPGARGEDTFLSTCLSDRIVLRVPSYTFHDGFSTYKHLLDGVLPTTLKPILANDDQIITRFFRACIGWARYKPLLLYITDSQGYNEKISMIQKQLEASLPAVCDYFNYPDFMNVLVELKRYHKKVKQHHHDFLETQRIWSRIMEHLSSLE